STAALAFNNPDDAREVLAAFRAQPHVVAARLYRTDGSLLAFYGAPVPSAPDLAREDGYRVTGGSLVVVQPVTQGGRRMGSLYLQSDSVELYEHLRLFALIGVSTLLLCCIAAYLISRHLQQLISRPLLQLARTAQTVSEQRDYSVRAERPHGHEFGL